jgi:hypothetical protein
MNFLNKLTDGGDIIAVAVEGRHCQGDADIFAYECCDYSDTLDNNIKTLKLYLEQQRLMSGSEVMNLHLTMGSKAGRYEKATVKEYQANRTNRDPEQQARVWELRHFMETYNTDTMKPYAWYKQEADDGMTQMQIARNKSHGDGKSVIMTMDKDLRMAPGLHIHPSTYEANTAPDGYGSCEICEKTSSKKVVGWGTSFFWHQMLMGDTADNIPGLPKLSGQAANIFKPTKVFNPNRSNLACGPMLAYAILDGIDTDSQAMARVTECYKGYYGLIPFAATHWDGTQFQATWQSMFLEQAHLLWMQRVENEDFMVFLKEIKDKKR